MSVTADGAAAAAGEGSTAERLVLVGVRCPLNWARAKVRLEEMPVGARLALVVDDPRAVRDIPRAAEAHGWAVIEVADEGGRWRIEIER